MKGLCAGYSWEITPLASIMSLCTSERSYSNHPDINMKKRILIYCFTIIICFSSGSGSQNSGIVIDNYASGLSDKWQSKIFEGETEYSVTENENIRCIQAVSDSSASALIYEIKYNLKEYPFLSWKWKIDHVLEKGNAHIKEGDDYAARVYVIFPSIIFWKTKAINYIWASRLPEGKSVPNPFTGNAIMMAVESGDENAGKWITEKRNVYEDYKRLFGKEPPKAGAIAIMTDTDNTGERAIAWYGTIKILKQ
jgi:hypothetical protein